MRGLVLALRSSVGQKSLAGASGLFLLVWICLHALGNLSAFGGPEAMDGYARLLRHAGGGAFLWALRGLLVLAFSVHIVLVAQLARRAQRARPVGYRVRGSSASAVWVLRLGGCLLAGFLAYHVLQLEWGVSLGRFTPGQVYANLVRACASLPVALVYVAAALALGAHVAHGLGAALASLGVLEPGRVRIAARSLGILLGCAFAVAPLGVLLGWLS